MNKVFFKATDFFSSIALFFTFSRVIIFCFMAYLLYYFVVTSKKKDILRSLSRGIIAAGAILFLLIFQKRFFIFNSDFFDRLQLTSITFSILRENMLIGVGLNNFFIHELAFQKVISPILLQPVHSIYLLIVVQLGLLGSILPAIFIWKTVVRVWNSYRNEKNVQTKTFYKSLFALLISTLVVGLFDHFLLTLQQGQIMFALILGLCWVNFKTQKLKE
jgi:hypothetical protein